MLQARPPSFMAGKEKGKKNAAVPSKLVGGGHFLGQILSDSLREREGRGGSARLLHVERGGEEKKKKGGRRRRVNTRSSPLPSSSFSGGRGKEEGGWPNSSSISFCRGKEGEGWVHQVLERMGMLGSDLIDEGRKKKGFMHWGGEGKNVHPATLQEKR